MKQKLNNTVVLGYVLFEEEQRNSLMPRERIFRIIASAELLCRVPNAK